MAAAHKPGDDTFEAWRKGQQAVTPETPSGIPVKEFYQPEDIAGLRYSDDLGDPGAYPFTRGVHKDMYRGRTWTLRSQVGFGTPKETNERLKYLYAEGTTGFVLTIDLPTSYGYDSDHPFARGEVGLMGVAISTLEDFETIYDGLSPTQVSGSLSIRPPISAALLAMLTAMCERREIPTQEVIGTIQNDAFFQMSGGPQQTIRHYFPEEQIFRLCLDVIEHRARRFPKYNWMVVNAYNLRETGVTAVIEGAVAIALACDVFTHALRERQVTIDEIASRASFFCAGSLDFFEEVAKFRAMRRIWARCMRERFQAQDPRSWWFRTSVQTAGNTLTAQQPLNNIVRGTCEALAAIFGGVQSIQVSSYDEGLGLPTPESHRMSLRVQQILGYETGVTRTADPLAGSYFVESLTDQMEQAILQQIAEIEEKGGMIAQIRNGWLEEQITRCRLQNQRKLESEEKVIVGLNRFQVEEDLDLVTHTLRPKEWEQARAEELRAYHAKRNARDAAYHLHRVQEKTLTRENMIPVMAEAFKAGCTLGEVLDAMREAVGFRSSGH